jgi:predicted component of type VI protein secretion system
MELDPDAKRILELTREARTPSADDKDRVARRLAGALALGAMTAHAGTSATTKGIGAVLASKWAVVAMVAAAGGAGYLGLRAQPAPAPRSTTSVPSRVDSTVRESTASDPARAEPHAALSDESAAQRDEKSRHPALAKSAAPHATLSEELDLLHEAQAKWRSGNASAALSLVTEHRARFPHSALGPERDALAVLSLCATNRVAEAKRLARHFLATSPHSPLKTSVEESCGGK